MEISKDLKEAMVSLRLSGIVVTLAERISYARSKKLSYEEFLEIIFFDERERRQASSMRLYLSGTGKNQISLPVPALRKNGRLSFPILFWATLPLTDLPTAHIRYLWMDRL